MGPTSSAPWLRAAYSPLQKLSRQPIRRVAQSLNLGWYIIIIIIIIIIMTNIALIRVGCRGPKTPFSGAAQSDDGPGARRSGERRSAGLAQLGREVNCIEVNIFVRSSVL